MTDYTPRHKDRALADLLRRKWVAPAGVAVGVVGSEAADLSADFGDILELADEGNR